MFACGIRVLSSETLSSCHKDSVILTDFLILNSTSQWKSVRSIWGSIVNENFQTALRTRWGSQPRAGGICCFTYHSCNNCVSLLIWFCSTWKGSVLNSYDFNLYLSKFRAGTLYFLCRLAPTQNFPVYFQPLLQQECNLITIMALVPGLSHDQGTLMLCKVLPPSTWTLQEPGPPSWCPSWV